MEAEFRARMENLSDFYMGKLAVHSAVEYWSKRMVVYNRLSNTWGAVSAVWLAVAAMVLLLTLGSIGAVGDSQHDANDEQTIRSTVIGVREWLGSLTRVGLVVAAFVWPLRIFVRNYLSNAHLATDAGERAIIVQTYLALINDPLLEDDLELKKLMLGPVIESMFRHASDGIVKDDGMPWQPTMFADMVKAASSK